MNLDTLPEGPTPEPELGPADDVLRTVLGDVTADHPNTADWPPAEVADQ